MLTKSVLLFHTDNQDFSQEQDEMSLDVESC